MKRSKTLVQLIAVALLMTFTATWETLEAQQKQHKMATDIPASITTPDVVETSLGTLRFFDGFPDKETVNKVYDNLDFQRGVQAFLTGLPAASMYQTRQGYRSFGPDNKTILITESFFDSRSLFLVANTETIYLTVWGDTKEGPLVIEVPPDVLGFVDDNWCRYVVDMGRAGQDKGKGGKYLLLPPGYKGEVPDGYFVAQSPTYGNFIWLRGFIYNGNTGPTVENMKKHFRIYPLSQAANPPEMHFVNVSEEYFNCIPANDMSFYDDLNQVVQEEPLESVDPEVRGLLASIGIQKGKPFAPDSRMTAILADAVAVGNATARTILFKTRDSTAYLYPGSWWKTGFIGGNAQFAPDGVLNPDARTYFYYVATGVTPAMAMKMVGIGSQYALTEHDASGNYLDGAKNYKLHLPPNIPAKDFWSVIVYDPQTRSLLQTDQQFPSRNNQKKSLIINPDSSVDIYFGPSAPAGKEPNWIQTIPGKAWWVSLRLYGPLEPWFDKTWRPGEIELIPSTQSPAQSIVAKDDPLTLWNEGPAKASILNFIGTITDRNNPGFLGVEERVAVFDMDGTILLEKPGFVLLDFVIRRLTQQIAAKPELIQNQPYKAVYEQDWAYFEKLSLYGDDGLYGILLYAYDGFTDNQYMDSVKAYFRTVIDKRYQKPYTELFFAPMLQLISYLHENQFEVYIVSGSDTEFIRSFSEDAVRIPACNVIGTTVLAKWVENGNGSYFVREHRFVEPVNDEAGKPVNILNRIGKVPVMAVGNSTGDYHMLEYSKKASMSLQMIVNHDDPDREYSYEAEKMKKMCFDLGWKEISMKKDFKVIFNN